jgi:hypothetical protein
LVRQLSRKGGREGGKEDLAVERAEEEASEAVLLTSRTALLKLNSATCSHERRVNQEAMIRITNLSVVG